MNERTFCGGGSAMVRVVRCTAGRGEQVQFMMVEDGGGGDWTALVWLGMVVAGVWWVCGELWGVRGISSSRSRCAASSGWLFALLPGYVQRQFNKIKSTRTVFLHAKPDLHARAAHQRHTLDPTASSKRHIHKLRTFF